MCPLSAADAAAFASAVARCLAELPAVAVLERVGGGGVIPASSSNGTDNSDGCVDPTSSSSSTKEDANAASRPQLRDSGGGESEMMDVDAPVFEIAGEVTTGRIGGGAANPGEKQKRELVPGVAWPEWRGSCSWTTAARPVGAGEALPMPPAEASKLSETASPMPPRDALVAPATGTALGLAGEHGGLWFPPSLTSGQRAMVMTAAGELGLCHDSVTGETGGVRVVVWELAAALTPSTSQKGPAHLPPDALAVAVAVAVPSGGSNTRRGSSLPLQQAVMTDPEAGRNHVASDHGDSTGASEGTQAQGGQAAGRRGSVAATRPAGGTGLPTRSAATAAEVMDDGKSVSGSSSVNGGVTASEESTSLSSSTNNSANGNKDAVVAAPATAMKARLRNVDQFGGGAVYAWGEGPPTAAAPSEAVEVSEELPDGQEWSVWSRDPQATSQAEGQAGEGGGAPTNGVTEMEEEPSPASRSGGDKAEGRRAETLRKRRENACFVVVGAVDGVAEEVTDAPEDAETWETRRVVVEVKNRMRKARHPPPLYDQIQLVVSGARRGHVEGRHSAYISAA